MPLERAPEIKFVRVNATADGDNTVVAGVASNKILVLGYMLSSPSATGGLVKLQDTNATPAIHAEIQLVAGGPASYAGSLAAPAFETATGEGVEINNPAGIDTLGHMTYIEMPASSL